VRPEPSSALCKRREPEGHSFQKGIKEEEETQGGRAGKESGPGGCETSGGREHPLSTGDTRGKAIRLEEEDV